jgi:hypothetical protein
MAHDKITKDIAEQYHVRGTVGTQYDTPALSDAQYEALFDQTLEHIDAKVASMRQTQQDINDLKIETRAMLRDLQAA